MRWTNRGRQMIPMGYSRTPDFSLRFDPDTQRQIIPSAPLISFPTTLVQDMPREASPTGKSGVGIAAYSIDRQPVEQLQRVFILTDPDPIYKGEGKLVTQGYVDPYASQIRTKQRIVGKKWQA